MGLTSFKFKPTQYPTLQIQEYSSFGVREDNYDKIKHLRMHFRVLYIYTEISIISDFLSFPRVVSFPLDTHRVLPASPSHPFSVHWQFQEVPASLHPRLETAISPCCQHIFDRCHQQRCFLVHFFYLFSHLFRKTVLCSLFLISFFLLLVSDIFAVGTSHAGKKFSGNWISFPGFSNNVSSDMLNPLSTAACP